MLQLRLLHLTFIGKNVEPASVAFGPAVTLVRGPSDTGKSFIVDAVDFMLGANALKEIPEREGYSTVLLGLELPDTTVVTLSRSVDGGNFGVYYADVREGPLGVPDDTLAAKHNPVALGNVSRYLLNAIGLDGRKVRKNARNETDSLSFRNVAHLCVVDETQMQADVPPALTGSYVTKTKEMSVLKVFLQDEDDSSLIPVESRSELAKLSNAKVDVVDRLLRELEAQLSGTLEASDLRDQLARLNASIDQRSGSVSQLVERRASVTKQLGDQQKQFAAYEAEWGDTNALKNRFDLLSKRYASDLARLATVRETGMLLGYFTAGTCVFCGAEPANQHKNTACEGDTTSFGAAVDEQARRTRVLANDLQATIADVNDRREELRRLATRSDASRKELEAGLAELEELLASDNSELKQLLGKRASIERSLSLYDQVETLEKMKRIVVDESTAETAAVAASVSLRAQREFSGELAERLAAWGFPTPNEVRYDALSQDVVAGDQLRSSHGKGVRAILHAAFTLSLAKYCTDREIPHPGFVVLDTPVLTYRPPDQDPLADGEPPRHVVDGFYRDIQRQATGQVIVMENTDPTEALDDQTVEIVFTAREHGRYGFFPVDGLRGATRQSDPHA
ncbi:hypothetical protein G6553_10610 [Nocardioides sp. IC4_145]|uniref:hypothetical protein n=1 Tax=Nocardioides sp. IC4_145 TaxID=2714037 RepID=UPI00140AB860|nr:hypothetical protein [Nocardioides sp. IC4_145]NHC23618.1 hypothetical protein [Nocardioides sp. IC4_145]